MGDLGKIKRGSKIRERIKEVGIKTIPQVN